MAPEQIGQFAGQVQTITSLRWLKIYWERDTRPYSSAGDFFRILLSTWHVTILCENSEVTVESVLNVREESWEEHEITVRDFVRLTAIDPNIKIDDYDEYILWMLAWLGIGIWMRTNDTSTIEEVIWRESLEWYKPDEIIACLENWDFYVCEVYHTKDAPIGYGEPNLFNHSDFSVYLLDIILSALDDAEINEFNIVWASLDISFFEWNTTRVTTIPAEFVNDIIYRALKRKNPLYQNMTFEKAREYYFKHEVIKKLADLSDYENE